jgi:hypothetical protein
MLVDEIGFVLTGAHQLTGETEFTHDGQGTQ